MKKSKNLASAISLAALYHLDQSRWDGVTPYILHPIEVMQAIQQSYPYDNELAEIAVLHDIIEDTQLTVAELKILVSKRVFEGVILLSKTKGQSYDDYISAICTNEDAVKVKIADISVNSRITHQV
jgi:(p)ppGpp synthase/HD superfamily hydrolase